MSKLTSIQQVPGDNLVLKLERFGEGQIPTWRELGFMLRCVERAALLLTSISSDDKECLNQFDALLSVAKKAVSKERLPRNCEKLGEQATALYDLIPRAELDRKEISIMNPCINSLEGLFWFMAGAIDFHCVADSALTAAENAGSYESMALLLAEDFDQLAFLGKAFTELDIIHGST